jgi:exodeoxyribonuclease V beta subunit
LAAAQKDQDEDLNRLLYVALTRAKQTVFLGIPDSENAVSKLLHGRDVDALGVHHSTLTVPNADTSRQAFVPPTEKIARLQQPKIPSWFFRSFSTLIKHDAHLDSARGADDEEVVTTEFGLNADWHKLPGGTETGQFIHDILEWHAQAHREDTDIDRLINKRWPAHLDLSHAPLVGQWIRQILSVELYPGVSLNQLGVSQKRPEPQFELPLKPDLRAQTLFNACRAFSWWEPLEPPIDQPIAGHLIGFIDLVFEYQGRFHIIDYKTNYLGPNDSSYGDVQLQAAMQRSFYPLQAAIYGLALHRWLGSRLPDYDPDRHLGDVTYLFCRGIHSNNAGLWRRPLETPGILALEEQCLCTR